MLLRGRSAGFGHLEHWLTFRLGVKHPNHCSILSHWCMALTIVLCLLPDALDHTRTGPTGTPVYDQRPNGGCGSGPWARHRPPSCTTVSHAACLEAVEWTCFWGRAIVKCEGMPKLLWKYFLPWSVQTHFLLSGAMPTDVCMGILPALLLREFDIVNLRE